MIDIDKKHQNSNDLTKAPLIDHLIELRSRLIKSIIVFTTDQNLLKKWVFMYLEVKQVIQVPY